MPCLTALCLQRRFIGLIEPMIKRLLKNPSSKAAASEMPRRTSQYVEALSDARTQLAVVFNNLVRGATGFDGDTDTTVACRALGDSYNSGKMQLPIKNWHSQLNLS